MYKLISILFAEAKAQLKCDQYTVFYNIPRIVHDFRPLSWARLPTLQNIVAKYINVPKIDWKHIHLEFADGVKCKLDYVEPVVPSKGTILLFHGFGGSSDSSYCKTIAKDFGKEYKVIVYNRRAHIPLSKSPEPPSHYDKSDLECVLKHVVASQNQKPIYGIGFSCGANLLMRYAGESGDKCVFNKMFACGNGWDYNHATSNIKSKFMNSLLCKFANRLYENVAKIDPRAKHQTSDFRKQELYAHASGDEDALVEYYKRISAIETINNIKTPSLCMDSLDDPFYFYHEIDHAIHANPNISYILTSHGGHCSWVESLWPKRQYFSTVFKHWLALTPAHRRPAGARFANDFEGA